MNSTAHTLNEIVHDNGEALLALVKSVYGCIRYSIPDEESVLDDENTLTLHDSLSVTVEYDTDEACVVLSLTVDKELLASNESIPFSVNDVPEPGGNTGDSIIKFINGVSGFYTEDSFTLTEICNHAAVYTASVPVGTDTEQFTDDTFETEFN